SFYSNNLRVHLNTHHFINSPHKHNTYIAILFTKGSGEHQIDFDCYRVKPGSIFLLSPGQVHNWTLSKDVDGYIFFHSREFYDSFFNARKITAFPFFYLQQNYPVIYLTPKNQQKIEAFFKEINTEFKSDFLYKSEKLCMLADMVYIELSRLYKVKEENITSNVSYLKIKRLQKFIDENFKTKKFPHEYAELMNMSTRHLSRLSVETLGKSTNDLIIERIIIEAKRMLVHNNSTVSMLADELGYDDYSYF